MVTSVCFMDADPSANAAGERALSWTVVSACADHIIRVWRLDLDIGLGAGRGMGAVRGQDGECGSMSGWRWAWTAVRALTGHQDMVNAVVPLGFGHTGAAIWVAPELGAHTADGDALLASGSDDGTVSVLCGAAPPDGACCSRMLRQIHSCPTSFMECCPHFGACACNVSSCACGRVVGT